jgi:hypothetical protein
VNEAKDSGQGSDAAKNDILALRGESQLPTLNINGRNPTVDGSEDMPLL